MDQEEPKIEGTIFSIEMGNETRYQFAESPSSFASNQKLQVQKGISGSQQSEEEIGTGNIHSMTTGGLRYIEPPYPPQQIADLLETDETHFRAVKAKMADIVGKPYTIKSAKRTVNSPEELASLDIDEEDYILTKDYRKEVRQLENFIEGCNPQVGFLGTLQCAAMDFEAVGWAAIEVIRSLDMKIARLVHIPAARVRVIKGHKGFVELAESTDVPYRFYQNFGEKVGKRRRSIITGRVEFDPFDPNKDSYSDGDLVWNLFDKKTGEKLKGSSIERINSAANEILFIPKVHPNTIYYGYTDAYAALSSIIINAYIRDYQAQFFQNNAVPRYAVIVTGGMLSDELRKALIDYFQKEVKGQAHKTLVMCLPSSPNKEIEVEFKQLDATHKEADFLETHRNNQKNIQVAHGTPPAILGVAEHSELGSGKGLSQAELYKDRIVFPTQYFWQEKLYQLTSKGLGLVNAYIGFSPFDVRDRYNHMQVLTGLVDRGIYNVNDCLEELDRPPVIGGDVNFIRGDKFIKISEMTSLDSTVSTKDNDPRNNSPEGETPDNQVSEA